ncbi:NUDIX domain-containing protein [Lederbergia lenta]|uniref:NUDIX domain-containing protein n=1 Tax=Lederbergia lenta TaxID=1467 RepID=UPI002041686F|nr:NUDIX domain-containing protein [Lederbergia lenta]MCM3109864.1 NUDIX domain-containing protein [Lederbergia lenta]
MSKMEEIILVSPRKEVFNNEKLTFQGVTTDIDMTNQIVANVAKSYSPMRRGDAEINPEYKQPIPYVVLKRGNEIYAYKRLSAGGEIRLHNQISIAVGGHMNPIEELHFYELIDENLKRELNEEVNIQGEYNLHTIGLINDDGNSPSDVGRVHLGLLYVAELERDTEVTVRETDQLEGFWIDIDQLKSQGVYSTLETWSQFVADIL